MLGWALGNSERKLTATQSRDLGYKEAPLIVILLFKSWRSTASGCDGLDTILVFPTYWENPEKARSSGARNLSTRC